MIYVFESNALATNTIIYKSTAITVSCADNVGDDDVPELYLSETEMAEELMHEHLEYEDKTDTQTNLLNELRQWALHNKISLTAMLQLLKLLNKAGIENLPLDARTVLKTRRTTKIVSTQWVNFGMMESKRILFIRCQL